MAKDKKLVEAITSMEEDFAQWYTDVVRKAELIDYSSVKGCMILRPAGYAIWENIQHELDRRFKETGVENVYLPLFIPESLLEKEKDHVEGFAPEVAWVTYGGLNQLPERLCVRPTSETLFCDFYKNIIQSYRDLPKVYNQWCSVVRWEKETRPFLRSREFLWQEGHTAHATAEEAEQRTVQMLNVYADFCEEVLAMPVVRGQKTEKEKFAGAEATYTIEALMHDGKALQSGTSHNFGNGFAKAFGIQYTDKDNKLQYVYQTSWGMTTRSARSSWYTEMIRVWCCRRVLHRYRLWSSRSSSRKTVCLTLQKKSVNASEKSAVQNLMIPTRARDGSSLSRK